MDNSTHVTSDDNAVLRDFFLRGGSPRMLVDIERSDLDVLYAYATQRFDAGDFQMARTIYLMLGQFDLWNFDYWHALGLTCQRLTLHEEAIFCFSRSAMIRVEDPRSAFYAGISYRLLGNRDYAGKAFNAAITWCGDRDECSVIKSDAVRLLSNEKEKG